MQWDNQIFIDPMICSVFETAIFVSLQSATSLIEGQLSLALLPPAPVTHSRSQHCWLLLTAEAFLRALAAVAANSWVETVGRSPLYGPSHTACVRTASHLDTQGVL